MLFKAYPTCICFLSDIRTCFLKNIFLNDIFCSTTYYTEQHIFFDNIYMFLNNTYMLNNLIGHMYVMYPWTTYMWSLCNIFMRPPHPSRLSWRSPRTNQQFHGHANWLFPQNISIVLPRLCSSSEIMFSTSRVHVPQWCRSCATLRGDSDT